MVEQTVGAAVSPGLAAVLINAVSFAGEQLSLLMDRQIQLRGTHVERLRLECIPGLREGEDRLVAAVHLGFFGDCSGHVVLSFSPAVAAHLAEIMLMEPVSNSDPLGEMECSVLGEVGNIAASAFLNSVANAAQLMMQPSPPTVVQDMIGALLSNVVVEMALESTHALLLHTVFDIDGARLQGELLLLPSADSVQLLEGRIDP